METFFTKLKSVLTDEGLRKRLFFVLGALLIFRLLAAIPLPGVNTIALEQFFTNNQFFGLLNILSGGGLANLSIVMLAVGPYITASIIMQLLTIMIPKLKALYHEEGEAGRKRFSQYSRLLTVPLAFIQGLAFLLVLQREGILVPLTFFAGIVAGLPAAISQLIFSFDPSQIPSYLALLIVGTIITASVVVVTEAERPVPVTYAKRVRGSKVYGGISTYLPLRVNQAGIIPIIFALSILLLPQLLLSLLARIDNSIVETVSNAILAGLQNQLLYAVLYFLLVFLFTYFYTAVTFDPDTIATNLQKSGAFVPGVRPGISTAQYLGKVITRITLVGALFLGFIAVLPLAIQAATGITQLAIGGTALLIAVSVVLDLVRKIDAQVSMREY